MKGKLIVMEGTDGSGKSTQFARLCQRLEQAGVPFQKLAFPQYSEPSSALIRMYLAGEFGTHPSDVNAYAASSFYAVDRYASYKKVWGEWYENGGLVVADRYCYGAMESRQLIEIREGETPLRAIARHYLLTSQCTRFMEQQEMRRRKQHIADLAREYKADGIIVASNKFCEYWSYERVIDTVVLQRDFGYPVCSIEKEYINSASGQLRTRFQAFIESVEIKKIQEGAKK